MIKMVIFWSLEVSALATGIIEGKSQDDVDVSEIWRYLVIGKTVLESLKSYIGGSELENDINDVRKALAILNEDRVAYQIILEQHLMKIAKDLSKDLPEETALEILTQNVSDNKIELPEYKVDYVLRGAMAKISELVDKYGIGGVD